MTKLELFQRLCAAILVAEYGFTVSEVAAMTHPAVVLRDFDEESHNDWLELRRQCDLA